MRGIIVRAIGNNAQIKKRKKKKKGEKEREKSRKKRRTKKMKHKKSIFDALHEVNVMACDGIME